MVKAGIKTTEFWVTVVALALTDAGAIPVPDKYKAFVTAAGILGYALSRGLAKLSSGAALDGAELGDEFVDRGPQPPVVQPPPAVPPAA
jgi:hypothetical protein